MHTNLPVVRRIGTHATRRLSHRRLSSGPSVPNAGAFTKRGYGIIGAATLAVGFGTYLAWPSSSKHAITSSSLPLSPYHFTPVTVESSEPNPLDPTTKVITLRIPPALLPPASFLGAVHSIYVKDDDIQVERPYTPLYGIEHGSDNKENEGRAVFWIKRYPHGEVGRWLHAKRPGDTLEIRGPVVTWDHAKEMETGKWDEIIMISGGTGITPFFQLLRARYASTGSVEMHKDVHFTLLHGSPTPSTLPPPLIMSNLQAIASHTPETFTMKVFVDAFDRQGDGTVIAQGAKGPAVGRITKSVLEDVLVERGLMRRPAQLAWWRRPLSMFASSDAPKPAPEPIQHGKNVLFLVCGPESMIEALAGPRPKQRQDLERTGVLGELGYKAANVRKL